MRASSADDVHLVVDNEINDIVSFESGEEPGPGGTGVEAIDGCPEARNVEQREHHKANGGRTFRWTTTSHNHAARAKEILQRCVVDDASV